MRVAIFDFDGTLYSKETFQLMMNHLKNHPVHNRRYRKFYRAIMPPYIGHKLKIYPEAKMRERSVQAYLAALETFSKQELEEYFGEIANLMHDDFNQEVIERLKQHVSNEDYCMLVSGAFTPLLHAVTKELPIEKIIGTEVPYEADVLAHKTPVIHIQGSLKTEKILEALGDQAIDWKNSFAYGDSLSDVPVLELVGNPVAVRPEARLRMLATERNWEII
ncbi:HAD-IB family hydrolase [Planococcus sp. CP5-4]|uniref:HAD family hydrolase n=1 Tax=unclassified Planococcus (in: firmicutes) TaxID=2662419 RepID=UPI001C21F509|nr:MULTISPECIES: HAD-IB family hydrolase [unclassified Planococcus (in: firmicutes)]MBU9673631.1 HAD-IB family hydrolase [Planococcus sp. CP5-4_YE]MBV0907921.1 HAD-IB family hydrolase [Planococcus sp. CP5-4_UN]MBW6063088.1 HAD-IB family hydrolase [Planococcus sp. CP5-4]